MVNAEVSSLELQEGLSSRAWMQGSRPSKRITCLGPLMVMESARTFCARGWSFPGWLVVLRELQSSHISTHLQGCFMWLGRCSLGPVLPLSHGSGPGWGWGTGRGGGAVDTEELASHLPSTSPWGLLLPALGFPGRGMCLCVCLALLHLTTLLQQHPPPLLFFFFWRGWPLWGERPGPSTQ